MSIESSSFVRWGLLSTARINERLIPCLRRSPRSEIVAVASRQQASADAFAAQWQIPQAHGSYEALLADPQVDAIYLSLPNHLHSEWAVRCADAGKHVLCEKPLALTTVEVDRMAEAAQRNGIVMQEAAMMRYHAQTDFVRELVAAGTIGDIRIARGLFTFMLEREGDIRWNPDMGGGSLWDLGSYCVRWMRTIFGAEPYEVSASQVTGHRGVDSSFLGELRFANGGVGHFFCSFAAFAHSEADVTGSRGRMTLDMPWVNLPGRDAHVHWEFVSGARQTGTFGDSVDNIERGSRTFEKVDAYQDEIESMVASILDGAPQKISLTDSYNNTAVINALYASAKLQRPVSVDAR